MDEIERKIKTGQPMLEEAQRACQACEEAKGKKPGEEIKRLRAAAELLMGAISDYRLGGQTIILH